MSEQLNTYNYFYKKTFRVCEKLLNSYYKKCKKSYRPYHFAYNNSSEALYNQTNVFNDKFNKHFPSTLAVFNDRANYYSKNDVKLILENEADQKYLEESNAKSTPYNSYSHVISELAQLEAINDIKSIMHINSSFFEKMYVLGSFKHFRFVNINSNTVLKKMDKVYREQLYGKDQPINEFELHKEPEIINTNSSEKDDYVNLPELQDQVETENEFLNVVEVSKLIGKAEQTIYGLVHRKEIPHFHKKRKLYFIEDDIINWIKQKDEPKVSISDKVDEFLEGNRKKK